MRVQVLPVPPGGEARHLLERLVGEPMRSLVSRHQTAARGAMAIARKLGLARRRRLLGLLASVYCPQRHADEADRAPAASKRGFKLACSPPHVAVEASRRNEDEL